MMYIESLKANTCFPNIHIPRRLDPTKPSIQRILMDHFENLLQDDEVLRRGLRPEVISNLKRAKICGTPDAGYSTFQCPDCKSIHYMYHTCKSRFCSSCGVKYAAARAKNLLNVCLGVKHRHVTFTIPIELRNFFRSHYPNLSLLSQAASDALKWVIKKAGRKTQQLSPGIICVIHTFGRDLKWNPHVHALVTEGGVDLTNHFSTVRFFSYPSLRRSFMKVLLDSIKKEFGITTKNLINDLYVKYGKDGFYVNAPDKKFASVEQCISYVVRYTGRPVIGNSRLLDYDGQQVTWKYTPHGEDEEVIVIDSALDFLKKLIIHIPPKQFKMVRYYGIYATSSRQTKLKRIRTSKLLYKSTKALVMQSLTHYRRMLMVLYNIDPIKCVCGQSMEFISAYFP